MFITVFVPKFQTLLKAIKILQITNVKLNFATFTKSDNLHNFDVEIERCINDLLRTENYDSALELSSIAELNSSEIILAQVLPLFFYTSLLYLSLICYLPNNIYSIEINLNVIRKKMVKLRTIFGMNAHPSLKCVMFRMRSQQNSLLNTQKKFPLIKKGI